MGSTLKIDPLGLSSSLRELARHASELYGIDCTVTSARTLEVSYSEAATQLYRIAQEAITNAVRHGESTRVTISLLRDDASVILQVKDNGHGIADDVDREKGLGLRSMGYRAGLIGAGLSVAPGEDGGTLVICQMNLADDDLMKDGSSASESPTSLLTQPHAED